MLTWLENRRPRLRLWFGYLFTTDPSNLQSEIACVLLRNCKRYDTTPTQPKGVNTLQEVATTAKTDPFHEARMRLSIQFPIALLQ